MKKCVSVLLILVMLVSMTGCQEIARQFGNVSNEFKSIMKNAGESLVEGAKEAAKEAVDEAVEDAKDKINDKVDQGKDKLEDAFSWNDQETVSTDFFEDPEATESAPVVLPQTGPEENTEVTDNETSLLPQTDPEENKEATENETPLLPQTGPEETTPKESQPATPTKPAESTTNTEPTWDLDARTADGKLTMYYDANGGVNAPSNQYFNYKTRPRLSTQKPQRPGYHFVGWSKHANDAKYLIQPGQKPNNVLTVNTVFYAIWEKHINPLEKTVYMPGNHNYSVKEQNSVVTITCNCGLEIKDRCITRSEFMYYCFNKKTEFNSLNDRNREKYGRKLALYKAQDVGPLALMFSTSFYKNPNKSDTVDNLFATVDEIAGTVDQVDDYVAEYANWTSKTQIDSDVAEEFFGKLSGSTEKVALAVSVYNTADSIQRMLDKDAGMTDATIGMLDTISLLTSHVPFSFYYEPMIDALKEGVKLWDKCQKYEKKYYDTKNLDIINNQNCAALQELFRGYDDPYLLFENFERGCSCYKGSSVCCCDSGPSVEELLIRIAQRPSNAPELNSLEKEMVELYLAERSEHELYQLTGLTLNEYVEIVG